MAWVLLIKSAHSFDYDFRLVPPLLIALLVAGTAGILTESDALAVAGKISDPAQECAKLTTCFGRLGLRVAQRTFAAQATYWAACDMHMAVMPRGRNQT